VFRSFAREAAPDMRIVGPASVGEAVLLPAMSGRAPSVLKTADLLSTSPRPMFDVFSYHFYGAASIRCASMGAGAQTTAEAALSEEWLSRADRSYIFYGGLRDRFEAGKPIWITEIADAACGGNPWANTFLDSFRYLDQHGRLARDGVSVAFHNTLKRVWSSRSDVRTASKLLGGAAVAPTDGAQCVRSRAFSTRPKSLCPMPSQPSRRGDASRDQHERDRHPIDRTSDGGGALHAHG